MKTVRNSILAGLLIFTLNSFSQNEEVEFDVYTTSVSKATRYLLADDVALRDCASTFCTQLTTIAIGTPIRLLDKSEKAETINGVTSRWYKIKMGPQVGWIWGGLISQKTISSTSNPEIKFVFGEAGLENGRKVFQIRSIINGKELDKVLVKMQGLNQTNVRLSESVGNDTIRLSSESSERFLVFKNDKFQEIMIPKTSSAKVLTEKQFATNCVD